MDQSLPQELLEAILDHLSVKDLFETSLVAHCFREPSQKRLFRSLRLGKTSKNLERTFNHFFDAVKISERLAAAVHSVQLGMGGMDTASVAVTFLANVLPILPALKTLSIDFAGRYDDLSSLSQPCQGRVPTLAYLRTIHLSNVEDFPTSFLSNFTGLHNLILLNATLSSSAATTPLRLPQTLMLVPASFWGESSWLFRRANPAEAVNLSCLRNLFIEFPWHPDNSFPPGSLRDIQWVVEATSQQLECLEIFLNNTASFCEDPQSKTIKFDNLRRLSFILEVDQSDMLDGADSIAYAALEAIVEWIKAVDAGERLQELHLSPRFMFDSREHIEKQQKRMIEQAIVPPLLVLEKYLTQVKNRVPPRVKISVSCLKKDDLEPIRQGLARLETTGLDVNMKEQYLGSSRILGKDSLSIYTEDWD